MSLPMEVQSVCAVCGEASKQTVLLSTSAFGYGDLDYRPPEMERSTMCWWVQECPHCGYVAPSLKKTTTIDPAFLQSAEYLSCAGRELVSPLAKSFFRQYLIALKEEQWEDAYYAVLYAAWACDDCGDKDHAVACRKLALELMEQLPDGSQPERQVQRADLLRRAGLFSAVLQEYRPEAFTEERLQKILRFQLQKAREQDADGYTIEDALCQ